MTMKTKRKADTHADELDAYNGKWKLLAFEKSGRSHIGINIYDSEGDAEKRIMFFAEDKKWKRVRAAKKSIPRTDFSHFIPIPVRS